MINKATSSTGSMQGYVLHYNTMLFFYNKIKKWNKKRN